MVSPKVISITPNRILNTPKVTKNTFGKIRIAILPSLPPVTPLKCRCTGRLRHGRENDCPSRYPPFFWFAPSHFENKGPWTGGRREGDLFFLPSVNPSK